MLKTNCLFLVLLLTLLSVSSINAQEKIKTKAAEEIEAYTYLNSQDYTKAYYLFDKLNAKYPLEVDYAEKLGVCAIYFPEKKERAIEIFLELSKKFKTPYYDYSLGKAYQVNYRFEEATVVLESLIARLSESKKKEDKILVQDAQHGLQNCRNGKELINNKVFADIKNIGAPINSEAMEYVPVISTDESVMYFTYRGEKSVGGKQAFYEKPEADGSDAVDGFFYAEDIYYSDKTGDSYSAPKPIESINTKGFEAAIGMSPDGQTMFTFNSSGSDSGDIFMCKLKGDKWDPPVRLNSNINTDGYWEGSCSISADGKYLYFSSEKPGGLGGRDIYVSEMVNGDWGPGVNLGPKINTKLHDDAPFIHPDGITLFFSSEGHMSIGGYDIMFTIKKDNEWTEPKSMGIPLNTTEDDSYYVINANGDRGYFSSNRAGAGGLGDFDIYSVTPGVLGDKPIIALLKGVVYGDDKPIEAKIEVVKTAKNENVGPYYSNMMTGKYLMALSPGSQYHLKISAEGFQTVEEDLDLGSLTTYMEKNKDFNLYSAGMAGKIKPKETLVDTTKKETVATITEPVKNETVTNTEKAVEPEKVKEVKTPAKKEKETMAVDTPCIDMLPDFGPFKGKSLRNEADYKQLLDVAGNYCGQNLLFKVQVGAYREPRNFRSDNIKNLGKIESESYPDGLTRFTQKQFKTLRDAERHRQKLIERGVKDAWIVVFSDGKRYTLEDFIMVDFLGKTVN